MLLTKDKNFYRELIKLAVPIALQSLVSFSLSLSDNIMIAYLGDSAASGVYMANQVGMLLQMISAGIEGAILVICAQLLGAKDTERARRIASLGVRLALAVSLVFSLVSALFPSFVISVFTDKGEIIASGGEYLRVLGLSFVPFALSQSLSSAMRCVKKAKIGFFASLSALILNIVFNYLLIFGKLGFPELKILGVGISTLIARIAELLVVFVYSLFIDKDLKLRFRDFLSFDKESVKSFLKTGAPIILAQLVWSVNLFFASALMGRQAGNGVVAGVSIANALYNLSYVVTNGMSGAVGVITARAVGSDKSARGEEVMREYSKSVQLIFIALGVLTALVMQAGKLPFISFWGVSSSAKKYAESFINVLSVLVVGTAYQSACLNGLIKSVGDTKFILKTESFFVFAVIIPVSLLASSLGAPPWAIFAALKCDQLLKCPVAFFKLKRFKFKKLRIAAA